MNSSTAAVPAAQLGPRAPAELDSGPRRVEAAPRQLARAERLVLHPGIRPGLAGHLAVELVHRGLPTGADVADQSTAPGGRPDEGVHHVVDVDEVAGLLAVTEDGDRLALEQTLGEDGHDAGLTVGILPRAVHVGQGQRRELQRVKLPIGEQVVDRRLLGDPVGGQRPMGQGFLEREFGHVGLAVQRASAGGEDHTDGPGPTGPFENPHRSEHVDVGVERPDRPPIPARRPGRPDGRPPRGGGGPSGRPLRSSGRPSGGR